MQNLANTAIFHPFEGSFILHSDWLELLKQHLSEQDIEIKVQKLKKSINELETSGLIKCQPSEIVQETIICVLHPTLKMLSEPVFTPTLEEAIGKAYCNYYLDIAQDCFDFIASLNQEEQAVGWHLIEIELQNYLKVAKLCINEIGFYTIFYLVDSYFIHRNDQSRRLSFAEQAFQLFEWDHPEKKSPETIENGIMVLIACSNAAAATNQFEVSLSYAESALNYYQSGKQVKTINALIIGDIYTILGGCHHDLTNYNKSIQFLQKAESILTKAGNDTQKNELFNALGDTYLKLEALEKSRSAYETALIHAKNDQDITGQARILHAIASIELDTNQNDQAEKLLYNALDLYTQLKDEDGKANIINELGTIALRKGQHQKSFDHYKKALAYFIGVEDSFRIAGTLANIAIVAELLRENNISKDYFEKAVKAYNQLGMKERLAMTYQSYGATLENLRDYDGAKSCLEESLSIYRVLGSKRGEADTLINLASCYQKQGKLPQSISMLQHVEKLFDELKDHSGKMEIANNFGNILLEMNDFGTAEENYRKALEYFLTIDNPFFIANTYQNLGALEFKRNNLTAAESYAQQALDIYQELDLLYHQAEIFHDLGLIKFDREQYQKAIDYFTMALPIFEEKNALQFMAECNFDLGKANLSLQRKEGMDYLRQASALFEALNDPVNRLEVEKWINIYKHDED